MKVNNAASQKISMDKISAKTFFNNVVKGSKRVNLGCVWCRYNLGSTQPCRWSCIYVRSLSPVIICWFFGTWFRHLSAIRDRRGCPYDATLAWYGTVLVEVELPHPGFSLLHSKPLKTDIFQYLKLYMDFLSIKMSQILVFKGFFCFHCISKTKQNNQYFICDVYCS